MKRALQFLYAAAGFAARRKLRVFLPVLVAAFALQAASAQNKQYIDPETKQTLRTADKLIVRGKFEEADSMLRNALSQSPKDHRIKLKLAYTMLKMRIFIEAYNLSLEVAKEDPKNPYAFAVLGSTLLAGGRFSDARLLLQNALTLNPKEPLALLNYGLLEFYENRLANSLDYLSDAAYLAPQDPDSIFALAQVSARAERYHDAANSYRRFLSISKNTDDDRRARIRGLIDFLHYLGLRESLYAISGAHESTIKVELIGNRPVILVRVNGRKEPLRFVLDTGSGISVVSDITAKRMKIKPIARGGHAKGIGGDGRFEIVYGFLREVQLGDVRIRNVPVYIREFHQNVNKIDGYVGISLISKFLTTIDYGNSTFSLARGETETATGSDRDGITLPLRLTSSGFLSGEIQMEGVATPMNFIVDTGASVSVISDVVAKREPISSLPRRDPLRVIGSAGITENVESFTLPKISFGAHSRESITAIALNLDLINDASGFEQAGILGGNFFLSYRMTFDFKNSRLMFQPTKIAN